MSGGITYDGVAVENGGNIFDGLKFWVAQRVPTRTSILEQIRNNAGIVVPLEKDADYCIADHARKDAPSGSISWLFVADSVKHGFVQMPDRYIIGQAPAGPRQAASGRPTKGTRAKFTDEEDAALARWVLAHDENQMGNTLYMQLGELYPTHTWQSWRNRFMKKLRLLPHEALIQMASRAADMPQAIEEGRAAQDYPDPTELMLQRRGQRIQQEAAARRAEDRAIQPSNASPRSSSVHRPQPPPPPQQITEQENTDLIARKNRFYEDLQNYCEYGGLDIAPTQQVAGQPVELWELANTVDEQRLPAEEIDWLRVAEELGYTWVDMDAAVQALQRCFEENLVEFLEVMDDVLGNEPEDQEPTETAHAGPSTASLYREEPPSSPAGRFLPAKRALDDDGELDIETPVKRRRLHIPAEIPSTPEYDRRDQQATPNTGKRLSTAATPVQFETQAPGLPTRESSLDMTPSQQLQSEHINSSPIPLHFTSATQNRQVGAAPSSKQSNTSVKRRVLSPAFKPQAPIEEEGSLFVQDDPDAAFPGALPSRQPPAPPTGRPAQVVAAKRRLSKEEELGDLIQHYESLGYAHKTVVEGLRRTTMTPGLATVVMQSIHEGQGVPTHHEGVWTDRDDVGLRLVNSVDDLETDVADRETMKKIRKARRTRDRLLDKHGQDRMTLRMKYLRANDSLNAAASSSAIEDE